MPKASTLLLSEFVTHDVRRLLLSRPEGLDWEPGQGIELMIDDDEWREEVRPFTPTSLRQDLILELTLKRYPERDGVTLALHELQPGAGLLIGEAFGTIGYQGPGTFIAAGTGLTPFLAILRHLAADDALDGHQLLLTNKTQRDVICAEELRHYLGEHCVLTFTHEPNADVLGQRIDADFLDRHIGSRNQYFYICGPDGFVAEIKGHLEGLGVDPERLVFER